MYESGFSVSATVSLLERANVSEPPPLAKLTSNNVTITQRCNCTSFFYFVANMLSEVDNQVIATSINKNIPPFSVFQFAISPFSQTRGLVQPCLHPRNSAILRIIDHINIHMNE